MDKELKQLIEKKIIPENEKRIKEERANILWLEFLLEKGEKELEELNKENIILPNQKIEKVIEEKARKKSEIETNIENITKLKKMKEKTIEVYQEYTEWLREKIK
jgi:hypothetical protein